MMPFYLEESDNLLSQMEGVQSVLVVPCRFCPAASLAVKKNATYLEPFRRLLRTPAYDSFVRDLVRRLEGRGIRTSVFEGRFPGGFVLCLSMDGHRRALAKRAVDFEAIVVLGCEGAAQTVQDAVSDADCKVIRGMEVQGLMNAIPKLSFPVRISLETRGMTPVRFEE